MNRSISEVLVAPVLSEKSVTIKDSQNRYTFKVRSAANKVDIKKAVETLFKVKVDKVRTMNFMGKMHKVGRYEGRRSDWKKAVVTVKAGQKIDLTDLPK
ncbi:MAG: 50S ribosomal protein L23 [Elusimicrobia bacterium GWA2_56_46]|nr:MAG: 50S ribosomal protein L23 [Elusimicrobia bacterium GWA2_56_46]OGR55020.1 MAG: 50S ribosomal protein L23 [Elusimicrobia bacterium GWC2_56_31]HBB67206.1 50S ribosomal protein L23 [Elusimicrobiota bacterium]HBW23967.1 50S ribosomal protein L23 [Elusimicrobiota bacterium]